MAYSGWKAVSMSRSTLPTEEKQNTDTEECFWV